jgi:hypothetical protein
MEQLGAKVLEDGAGFCRREVADAGTDIEGEGAGVEESVERERLRSVVGDLTANGDAGDESADVLCGSNESGLGDVDRLVDDGVLATDSGREENACLGGGPGTEFDEGEERCGIVAAGFGGERDDLVGVGGEKVSLGAREVVLRQLGDLLEEPRGEGFGGRG